MRKLPHENASDKRSAGPKSMCTFARFSLNKVQKVSNINTSSMPSSSASDNQTIIANFTETENSTSVTKSSS